MFLNAFFGLCCRGLLNCFFFLATKEEEKKEQEEEKDIQLNPLRKFYFCPDCDQQLQLTMTEILKHKKSHIT